MDYKKARTFLNYDCLTGNLFWRKSRGGVRLGELAGRKSNGYIRIGIEGKEYFAHRLAWLLFNKQWPNGELDHIDRNKMNNRISNLRRATRTMNVR